jgi:tetratricopeptide (TPR) repeat protein
LAVFAGGFTLDAAESVGTGEGLDFGEVFDALEGLVDKSLVGLRIDPAGQGRYSVLETVRTSANERLAASGELPVTTDRHAQFYARLARDCAAERTTRLACDRLEADHPNLLVALEHFAAGDQPVEHGRLVMDLSQFWDLRGRWRLGEREVLRYLARGDRDGALDAACLRRLAVFAARMGDYPKARVGYLEALVAAKRFGDRREQAMNLAGLGLLARCVADFAKSGANYGDASAFARDLGDQVMVRTWRGNLGMSAHGLADHDETRSCFERALVIAREIGDGHLEAAVLGSMGVSKYVANIGGVSLRLGNYAEARSHLEEVLAITRDLGDRRSEIFWIDSLGEVAREVGDHHEARSRCEEALAVAHELGYRRSQHNWLGDLTGIECRSATAPPRSADGDVRAVYGDASGVGASQGAW